MRKYLLIGLMVVTGFGCSSVNPYEGLEVDSVNDGIVITLTEIRSANALLQELLQANAIDTTEARTALRHLREAKATAMLAQELLGDDNISGANGRLEAAIGILDIVNRMLSVYVQQQASIGQHNELKLAA